MKAATIIEVAKEAGVSISTVSRVLNNSGYVSQASRRKVLEVAKDLGFRKNQLATSLRNRSSRFVGLVIPDISNEFFATLAKFIEIRLQEDGYGLFLCNTEENPEKERYYLESLCDRQVDAIVLTTSQPERELSVARTDLPVVFADRYVNLERFPRGALVVSDGYAGGGLAGRRLVDSGARQAIVLRDERNLRSVELRQRGFVDAVEQYGKGRVTVQVHETAVSAAAAERLVVRLLGQEAFDSIFCTSDVIAFGAMQALSQRDIAIPERVQIIGFDGGTTGALLTPPLSTVRQDLQRLGSLIGHHVVCLIDKREVQRLALVPVEYVHRGSTRPI